jgi:hypothetical protein
MLTEFQASEIKAIPDADLQRECASAIRLAHQDRCEFNRQWSGALWVEACRRGMETAWTLALRQVTEEIDAHRLANAAALAELKGRNDGT